jgi:hypothetical protein
LKSCNTAVGLGPVRMNRAIGANKAKDTMIFVREDINRLLVKTGLRSFKCYKKADVSS